MAKGVIVVDIPEKDCRECPAFCAYNRCGIAQRYVAPIVGKIPDWCPIKPMPERAYHENYCDNGIYDKGWNECLDELLKDGG